MGVVGKAGLAWLTAMRLCRFLTALVVVDQRFVFLVRQQISRQLAVVAVVVMVAHQLVVAAVDLRESRVVQVPTAEVVVLSRQGERKGTQGEIMAPPERHFSVDVAMTRAAAAAAAGLVVVAAETTLVVEVALVMFRY
jgi:hypothetical protein